jgi:hypothetical protein
MQPDIHQMQFFKNERVHDIQLTYGAATMRAHHTMENSNLVMHMGGLLCVCGLACGALPPRRVPPTPSHAQKLAKKL